MNAGAVAVIVANNIDLVEGGYTLGTPTTPGGRAWVPALFVSRADGDFLFAKKPNVKLTSTASHWGAANGTSFAAPHVSGAAALVLGLAPHLSRQELTSLLLSTAVDLGAPGRDDAVGAGMLDVDAATRAAAN
jgi:subtilisin family serine protease